MGDSPSEEQRLAGDSVTLALSEAQYREIEQAAATHEMDEETFIREACRAVLKNQRG